MSIAEEAVRMPTPSRTSLDEIVSVGRGLIEKGGLEDLTMQQVARAVGVQPPSLYKHVAGRDDLMRLIAEDVVADLTRSLTPFATGTDPRSEIAAIAHEFRHFAHTHPGAYRLIFSPLPESWRPDPVLLEQAAGPLLKAAGALAGPDRALDAARTLTAWAHGFVSMELAGAFRLGGDVDSAFAYGVDRLTEAMTPA